MQGWLRRKDIDQVIASQSDLTEILHTLKQGVCVKGWRGFNRCASGFRSSTRPANFPTRQGTGRSRGTPVAGTLDLAAAPAPGHLRITR